MPAFINGRTNGPNSDLHEIPYRGYYYLVVDPNYRDAPKHFDYDPGTRTFYYEPVYYFKRGPVTVRSIYRGLLQ